MYWRSGEKKINQILWESMKRDRIRCLACRWKWTAICIQTVGDEKMWLVCICNGLSFIIKEKEIDNVQISRVVNDFFILIVSVLCTACFMILYRTNETVITLEPRLLFPDSVGGIFSCFSHYSKSLSGFSMVFPAGGATMIDSFEHVD